MKEIKGHALNFIVLMLIVVNIGLIYYCITKEDYKLLFVGLLFINFFAWLINYKSFHYFLYDKNSIVVKNSWNPLVYKKYSLSELKQIKIGYIAFVGKSLIIYFDNGRKKAFGATNCSAKKLEEFATVLNDYIQSFQ